MLIILKAGKDDSGKDMVGDEDKGKSTTLLDTEVLLHCYLIYKLWYHLSNAILNCIMGYVINQARAKYLRDHLGLSKLTKENLGLLAEVVGERSLVKYISKDNIIMILTERLARVEALGRQSEGSDIGKGSDDDDEEGKASDSDKAKIQDKEDSEGSDIGKSKDDEGKDNADEPPDDSDDEVSLLLP